MEQCPKGHCPIGLTSAIFDKTAERCKKNIIVDLESLNYNFVEEKNFHYVSSRHCYCYWCSIGATLPLLITIQKDYIM